MFDTVTRIVGNRELILGIDHLYRGAMKDFEVTRLLPAARNLAAFLEVAADDGPVEGYYPESAELTCYFHLIRALQRVPEERRDIVATTVEFQQLWKVTQSPLFGVSSGGGLLLPPRRDALYFALEALPPERWTIPTLLNAAAREAESRDDISLVGLACRARDGVCVAALRETVVLYADVCRAMAARYRPFIYRWEVSPDVSETANRFIMAFNALTSARLPAAEKSNAEYYYNAANNNSILGRCVRIGHDEQAQPNMHYHWAVDYTEDGMTPVDFWDKEIWTTARFQKEHRLD